VRASIKCNYKEIGFETQEFCRPISEDKFYKLSTRKEPRLNLEIDSRMRILHGTRKASVLGFMERACHRSYCATWSSNMG